MLSLTARYVFPVDHPPLPHGVVTIEGERIVAVEPHRPGMTPTVDLGNVALIPGLVNAHTHLNFSYLASPLGIRGIPFPDWLRLVIRHRAARTATAAESVARGLAECIATGTTTVGEIASPGWPRDPFEQSPLDATIFLELLGLAADRINPLAQLAAEHLALSDADNPPWQPALSPHAPYTVHPRLLKRVAGCGMLAMHLAETREELELLRSGTGPLVNFLAERGFWQSAAIPPRTRPLDYLRILSRAERSLVIHGNYLNRQELEFLAEYPDRMSLVYCPRTHDYFGHDPYPLAEAIKLGVNVAIGTDSRASNPDLNLLSELRFIADGFLFAKRPPLLRLANVLAMGTQHGANALGRGDEIGTLATSKLANLTAIALLNEEGDPHELLFAGHGQATATWVRGQQVV